MSGQPGLSASLQGDCGPRFTVDRGAFLSVGRKCHTNLRVDGHVASGEQRAGVVAHRTHRSTLADEQEALRTHALVGALGLDARFGIGHRRGLFLFFFLFALFTSLTQTLVENLCKVLFHVVRGEKFFILVFGGPLGTGD
jgi:hypothetical protein